MAISFLQKVRLALKGWGRRREAGARQRDEDFLRRNTAWAPTGTASGGSGGGSAPSAGQAASGGATVASGGATVASGGAAAASGGAAAASAAGASSQSTPHGTPGAKVDLEGLCVAYLDESGRIAHYLDVATGEVIDHLLTASADPFGDAARYKRVPARSGDSEADDRIVFVRGLPPSQTKSLLEQAIELHDPSAFRKTLGGDRAAEKAWYSFKNDRAYAAIDQWLATLVR